MDWGERSYPISIFFLFLKICKKVIKGDLCVVPLSHFFLKIGDEEPKQERFRFILFFVSCFSF